MRKTAGQRGRFPQKIYGQILKIDRSIYRSWRQDRGFAGEKFRTNIRINQLPSNTNVCIALRFGVNTNVWSFPSLTPNVCISSRRGYGFCIIHPPPKQPPQRGEARPIFQSFSTRSWLSHNPVRISRTPTPSLTSIVLSHL